MPCDRRSPLLSRPVRPYRATRVLRLAANARAVTAGRTKLQGSEDWKDSIRPHDFQTAKAPRQIPEDLRRELIKYGELTQVTYDSFYCDAKDTTTFGLNKYPPDYLIKEVLLGKDSKKYFAEKYFYAESGRPPLRTDFITGHKMNRYWQGYAAVSEPDARGKIDVVFAWRGTIAGSEWSMDVQNAMCFYEDDRPIGVAEGFSTMFMVSQNRDSPQVQVKNCCDYLWNKYGNQLGSFTVCGHSLGGALAHLCAFDLADKGLNKSPDGKTIPVTAYTFCSPRVGDEDFKKACEELDVKVLRTVNIRDIVPKVPGLTKDETKGKYVTNNEKGGDSMIEGFDVNDPGKSIQDARAKASQRLKDMKDSSVQRLRDGAMAFGTNVYRRSQSLKTDVYVDVGSVLEFDIEEYNDTFKTGGNMVGALGRAHNLEVLLHMIDPNRDPALCNKSEDALLTKFNVPPNWYVEPYKGMRVDKDGHWKRTYEPFVEPQAVADNIGQKTIDEAESEVFGKFPDMSGITGKLPFGRWGKQAAGSK